MIMRKATVADFDEIWPVFREVVRAGDTYAYPPDTSKSQAEEIWMAAPLRTYIAEDDGQVLGTYYLKRNHQGPADHICNCGYMVSSAARGRGVATAMCEHSQQVALTLGFTAMQFNLVVETNAGAVRLWQRLGFEIVGTIPRAFRHPHAGLVSAHVMYKWLESSP